MSSPQLSTRNRILEATWRLMEQRRGLGVRIEDIARLAGISRQAVYMHFGTRSELLIATTHYLDETLGVPERLQQLLAAETGLQALDAYVDFWANYIPEVYGLARALLTARETDEAAAAAWKDRMDMLYQGCISVAKCLARDGVLASEWTIAEAADFCWASISVAAWANLTIDRGWSQEQYVIQMKTALRRVLTQDGESASK